MDFLPEESGEGDMRIIHEGEVNVYTQRRKPILGRKN